MKIDITDDELQLMIRSLSIHRVQTRRKLERISGPSRDHTLRELRETQALVNKLQISDLDAIAS